MSEEKIQEKKQTIQKFDSKSEKKTAIQQKCEKKIHYPNGYLVRRPE